MLIVETIAKEVAILFVFVLIVLDLSEVFILDKLIVHGLSSTSFFIGPMSDVSLPMSATD